MDDAQVSALKRRIEYNRNVFNQNLMEIKKMIEAENEVAALRRIDELLSGYVLNPTQAPLL